VKKQVWQRLGRIFGADQRNRFFASHASYPTPLVVGAGVVRVFFSPRDDQNRSSIAYLDLGLDGDRFEVLRVPDMPLLEPGPRGAFDDCGASVSCVIADNAQLCVYYLGWTLLKSVPFQSFIGLATGEVAGAKLVRQGRVPILDRSEVDPWTLGYPWVLRDDTRWRMWYGSHIERGPEDFEVRHTIKDATSPDGRSWQRSGRIVIPLDMPREFGVSRPSVLQDSDRYRMWYARRQWSHYSLGYAESPDGLQWMRQDEAVTFTGPLQSWEAGGSTYPAVFDCGGNRYLLYNGTDYGRTGFGLARLMDDP
jgi:hypothetical protein